MALHIKDKKTHRMARQLAKLTGKTISDAVALAISERIERVKNESLSDKLMRIAKDCGKRWKEPWKPIDHAICFTTRMGYRSELCDLSELIT